MGWVYIFNPKTSKYQYVEEDVVEEFNVEKYLSLKSAERSQKVYKIVTESGKTVKVQILGANVDLDQLKKEVSLKRIRVPKLNKSLFNESTGSIPMDDVEDNVKRTKQERKATKKRRSEVRTQNNNDIINEFTRDKPSGESTPKKMRITVRPQKSMLPPNEEEEKGEKDKKKMEMKRRRKETPKKDEESEEDYEEDSEEEFSERRASEEESEDNEGNGKQKKKKKDEKTPEGKAKKKEESHLDKDDEDDDNNNNKKKDKTKTINKGNVKGDKARQENSADEESIQSVRSSPIPSSPESPQRGRSPAQYNAEVQRLKNRVKELEDQLKKVKKEYKDLCRVHQACDKEAFQDIAAIPVGQTKGELTHAGYNVWIKQISYDEAFKCTVPASFVSTMAKAIWDDAFLGAATTRETKGVQRILFSPKRKGAVSKCYSKWLDGKFSPDRKLMEENLLHAYLNRVTDGARKREKKRNQTAS